MHARRHILYRPGKGTATLPISSIFLENMKPIAEIMETNRKRDLHPR